MTTSTPFLLGKRSAAGAMLLMFAAVTAHADQFSTTVEIGKTKTRSLRRELSGRPSVTVDVPGIVDARFDSNRNVLTIKGLRPGQATVTFSAEVRVLQTGIPKGKSIPVEGSRAVSDTIEVTVPEPKDTPPAVRPIVGNATVKRTIRAGKGVSLPLRSVADLTRNIEVTSSDPTVAKGKLTSASNYIVVSAVGAGDCTIMVRGDAKNRGGTWRPFVRRVNIVVNPGS